MKGAGKRLSADAIAEVYRRIALGHTAVDIANDLGCSEKTVGYHKAQAADGAAPRALRKPNQRNDASAELQRERRAMQQARDQRSADRQLRAYRARQAALAALREYVPGYDGVAHGATGLLWANVPRRSMG